MAHKIGTPKITAKTIKKRTTYCSIKFKAYPVVSMFSPKFVGLKEGFVGTYEMDTKTIVVGCCKDGLEDIDGGRMTAGFFVGKCEGEMVGFVGAFETDGRDDNIFVGPENGDEDTFMGRLVGKCVGGMVGFVDDNIFVGPKDGDNEDTFMGRLVGKCEGGMEGIVGAYETDGWYDIIIVGSEVGNEDTIMGRLVGKCVSIVGIYETDGWYDSIIVGLENDIEGSMIGRLVGKCKGDIEGTVGTYETDGRYDCTLVGSEDGDEDTIIGRLVG